MSTFFKERLLQLRLTLSNQEAARRREENQKQEAEEKIREQKEALRQREIVALGELAEENFRPILQAVNEVFAFGRGEARLRLEPRNSEADEGFTKYSLVSLELTWDAQRKQFGETDYIERGKRVGLSLRFDNSVTVTGQDPKERISLSDEGWREKVYDTLLDAIRLGKHHYSYSTFPEEHSLGVS